MSGITQALVGGYNKKANTVVTFQTTAGSETNLTTYTFSNVSIGGPGVIVVCVHAEASVANYNLSSVSIGGSAATIAKSAGQGLSSSSYVAAGMAYREVTSGTTATIAVTFTNTMIRCAIGVFRVQTYTSVAPVDSKIASQNTGSSLSVTLLSIPEGAGVIAAQTNGDQTASVTWTGITESYDMQTSGTGNERMAAGYAYPTSSGNYQITTSYISTTQPQVLVAAAWE